jgi:predicted TPR repeat methyltransferase
MLAFLMRFSGNPDLIVAADAFVYLPDLRPVCAAAARVLSAGGLLAFSVEAHTGSEPYRLQETLRYAHSEGHVKDALRSAGLSVAELFPCSTRDEAGAPVPSLTAVGTRPE